MAPPAISVAINAACDSRLDNVQKLSPVPRDIHTQKRAGSTLDSKNFELKVASDCNSAGSIKGYHSKSPEAKMTWVSPKNIDARQPLMMQKRGSGSTQLNNMYGFHPAPKQPDTQSH